MTDGLKRQPHFEANFQSNLIAGLLTVTPLIVVWLVFDFFLTTLSNWGHPLAVELTLFLDSHFPALRPFLDNDAVRYAIGIVVALLALYSIGAIASRVIGQQLILLLESLIAGAGRAARLFRGEKTGRCPAPEAGPTDPARRVARFSERGIESDRLRDADISRCDDGRRPRGGVCADRAKSDIGLSSDRAALPAHADRHPGRPGDDDDLVGRRRDARSHLPFAQGVAGCAPAPGGVFHALRRLSSVGRAPDLYQGVTGSSPVAGTKQK